MAAGWALLFVAAGEYLAKNAPNHSPVLPVAFAAGLGVAAFIICGLVLALRDSWVTRQVTWAITFAVPIFASLALWLGGTYDAEYVGRFSIPGGAVPMPTLYRVAIASKSALIGLGFVLLFIAILGWARFFHGLDDTLRWLPLLMAALVSAVYLLTALVLGLSSVEGAASGAAARASAGRQPAGYFGIQGTLECVRPVTASIPAYNGPLPTNRPLLSFGTTNDYLWVWDPASNRSIGVPLDDVSVTPAAGTPARCR